jgi:hypothetical protein
VPEDPGTEHKRQEVHLARPDFPNTYSPFCHYQCVHNELVAIHNRVCGLVPEPTSRGLQLLRSVLPVITHQLPKIVPKEIGCLSKLYGGAKRAKYKRAEDELRQFGISSRNSGCTMFIKCEHMDPTSKINPDPRAITFRDPVYCAYISCWLKEIEHHLYALRAPRSFGVKASRIVGKGLNQIQRARVLAEKLTEFSEPIIFSLDMKRFDQHCSYELLEIEHLVYLACNSDPEFAWLLSKQLINKIRTRSGYRYTAYGKNER